MVFCWIVLQFSSSLFKVTHLSHAMCHVLSATLDTIIYILQYSSSSLYCTNIKIHKRFIKYNVRKTVNPILFRLRLLKVLFDPFELDILLIKTQSRLESPRVLPKMAFGERLHPKGIPFSGWSVERVGISLVEVYERVGKTVISVGKKAQEGLTDALHAWLWKELSKRFGFVIYSYFKDSAGTAVKRDAKF